MTRRVLEGGTAPADASARSIVLAVLRRGPASRADLARRLGLSTASLTRLTRPMVVSGLLTEQQAEPITRAGRPSRPLDIAVGRTYFLGVKITRDALHTVVCDLKGTVVDRDEEPVTDRSAAAVTARLIERISTRWTTRHRIDGVGIGVGGEVAGHRVVRQVPALGWNDVPLADLIADATGLPVTVDNDVRALTRAAHWFGAGRGCSSLLVITVGVGVGCAVVVEDQLLEGHHGLAAQVDHWTLDPDGPRCRYGHRGCADALLTSGALAGTASVALGRPVTVDQCIALAAAGDPTAIRVIDDAASALALLTARVADVIDPERILITGDGIGFVLTAEERLRTALAEHRCRLAGPDELLLSRSDFFDWARGAAAVAIRRHVLTELVVT